MEEVEESPEKMTNPEFLQLQDMLTSYYKKHIEGKEIVPGADTLPVSGKIFDETELHALLGAMLDCWWTEGRFVKDVQRKLADYFGRKHCLMTNSGSSANLLAISALTSPLLGERRLKQGDEIITVAAGFPTTVAPIIQNGCIPVLIDVEMGTYNVDVSRLEEAVSDKTKAIMIAHTLGNPFNVDAVISCAKKHKLWVVEDCCDALGAEYKDKKVGTQGDIATLSFYPAHHITAGEGGAVFCDEPLLKRALASFRDWGRDCWCAPGKDNTCGQRFLWQLGDLPKGYDHKYIYSHVGYNLKNTDLQASILSAQIPKIEKFVAARRKNFTMLKEGLSKYEKWLLLPKATPGSNPSWFGFPISVRKDAGFTKNELVTFIEGKKISTRPVFAGNMTKQPMFEGVKHRVVGPLTNTDTIMESTFWIGVWPGLKQNHIEYILSVFEEFFLREGIR